MSRAGTLRPGPEGRCGHPTSPGVGVLAASLKAQDILIKPLHDPVLGPGYMRITTALPEDNRRFVAALRGLLARA